MTIDQSQPDHEEALLARFLHELESAPDRAVVVAKYSDQNPAMAEELARLEAMNRLVARAGSEESGSDIPKQLGEFRIIRRIARGGMGDIYEAVQDRLNRRVTVKTIRRGRISQHARGRFFREQRVLARLHQTHIVPIHTAGEDGDLLYFAMPFIDGAPLHQVVHTAAAMDTAGQSSKTPSLTAIAVRVTVRPPEEDAHSAPMDGRQLSVPRRLSIEYYRSVARVMADAAEAVEHAHRMNILHRDLKPSNILLDRQGQCWIIDFGLAGYVGQTRSSPDDSWPGGGDALTVGGLIGTPQYMSPEQWRGEPADVRSDVWGLGATLYELLTLQRVFDAPTDLEAQHRVLHEEPATPRSIVSNVPVDLAAVCLKALRKTPDERYPTARAFADDLRRWLQHEPVRARPVWVVRRAILWARRNRGWAAALLFTLVAALALAGLEIRHERTQAAHDRGERLMLELQRERIGNHRDGWRDTTEKIIRNLQNLRPTDELRNQAAALLTGVDAQKSAIFPFAASAVAFDPAAARLLLGGLKDKSGRPESGARLIDLKTREVISISKLPGAGPVAFQPDGTPCQLAPKDSMTLVLWDLKRQQAVIEFSLLPGITPDAVTEFNYPVLALSADGLRAAASTSLPGERATLVIWDTLTGRQLRQWDRKAECLAFTPDGAWFASGYQNGRIIVDSLNDDTRPLELQSGSVAIKALAFGRDPIRGKDRADMSWRLASGDAGTRATVWDLQTGHLRCHCNGLMYGVAALTFSPDGMTLATAGRQVGLWDAATGQRLLEIPSYSFVTDACFSPDGRHLAVCTEPISSGDQSSRTDIWELDPGRGTTTLRGLFGPVAKTVFSRDGRYVAAISQQWQVAVWDLTAHRLLHIFDGPAVEFVDNAALTFDHSGSQIACAGGTGAILWDIASGRELQRWQLPSGLQDALAFDPAGLELWSIRCETTTGVPPHSHANFHEHPRVYRVRNLLGPRPTDWVKEIKTPDDHVSVIVITPDASIVAISGTVKVSTGHRVTVRAFALPTGTELWSAPAAGGDMRMDPLGKYMDFGSEHDGSILVDVATGRPIRKENGRIDPSGNWWLRERQLGFSGVELADIDIDRQNEGDPQFSPCGRFLATGRRDGTVIVYELEAFRQQLMKFAER